MLCCVGLIGGLAVGQSLGGPWTYIAPAVGFGVGFVGDMKFMQGMHGKGARHETGVRANSNADLVREIEADASKVQPQALQIQAPQHQVPQLDKG